MKFLLLYLCIITTGSLAAQCPKYFNKKNVLQVCLADTAFYIHDVYLNGKPVRVIKESVWIYGPTHRDTPAWDIILPGEKKISKLVLWIGDNNVFMIKKKTGYAFYYLKQ